MPGRTDESHIRDALRLQNKMLAILIQRVFNSDGPVEPEATEATEAWIAAADEISAIRVKGDKPREVTP